MARPARVLILDDRSVWREELSEMLAETDCEVVTSATLAEARELYDSQLFHVLVLDVRLEDEDRQNEEGMELLRDLSTATRSHAVSVVMCSGYADGGDWVREAFSKYGVVDFLSKGSFTEKEFVELIEGSLRQKLRTNLELEVHWERGVDASEVVHNLLVGEQRTKWGTPQARLLASELEELLGRLFEEAESVVVGHLGSGWSGAGVLLAQPCYAQGAGRRVVVKFGDFDQIDAEHKKFRQLVEPFVGGGRSTAVLSLRSTQRLGGMVYNFIGTSGGRLADYSSFYRDNELSAISEVHENLFQETCASWYDNSGPVKSVNLTRYYMEALLLEPERLAHAVKKRLKSVQGEKEIHFNSLSQRDGLPNPLAALEGSPWVLPSHTCITHGDLSPSNILIDGTGHAWLIDFQHAGEGHLFRDFIKLDCAIRFELLAAEEATLDERRALEEAMLEAGGLLQQDLVEYPANAPRNPAVEKAFGACMHLRYLAGRKLADYPENGAKEYYVGALYYALSYLKFYRIPALNREHALLSAALLTRELGQ